MSVLKMSNIHTEKRHDEEWNFKFDMDVDGDTCRIDYTIEFDEHAYQSILYIWSDGIDLAEEKNWPNGRMPRVVKALGGELKKYSMGNMLLFDAFEEMIREELLYPLERRIAAATAEVIDSAPHWMVVEF